MARIGGSFLAGVVDGCAAGLSSSSAASDLPAPTSEETPIAAETTVLKNHEPEIVPPTVEIEPRSRKIFWALAFVIVETGVDPVLLTEYAVILSVVARTGSADPLNRPRPWSAPIGESGRS